MGQHVYHFHIPAVVISTAIERSGSEIAKAVMGLHDI